MKGIDRYEAGKMKRLMTRSRKKDTSLVAFEMKSKIYIMADYGLYYLTLPLLTSLIYCCSLIPLLVSATFTLCSLKFLYILLSFSLTNSHPSFQVQLQCHLLGKISLILDSHPSKAGLLVIHICTMTFPFIALKKLSV